MIFFYVVKRLPVFKLYDWICESTTLTFCCMTFKQLMNDCFLRLLQRLLGYVIYYDYGFKIN